MALFQKLENHFRKFVRLGLGKKEVALSMYLSANVKLEPSQLPEGRYHISSPRGPYKQIEGRLFSNAKTVSRCMLDHVVYDVL